MGQRNQGIFSIEKRLRLLTIKRELTMTLMRLLLYFNRLTALINTQHNYILSSQFTHFKRFLYRYNAVHYATTNTHYEINDEQGIV